MSEGNVSEFHDLKQADKIPFKDKFYYSFAQLPDNFYTGTMGVLQAFYYGWLGLTTFWITIAQILFALWNVINDPIFGTIEDRTRSTKGKGRYMPYIKYGAPIFSLFFALVFLPPDIWRGKQSFQIQLYIFLWYVISLCLYDTLFTIVLIAHVALLPQMTLNQKDRTQIQLLCTLFAIPAFFLAFLLPAIFLAYPTPQSVASFKFLVICFAIFGVIPYWLLVHYVKEHSEYIPENKTGFFKSVKTLFKNRSFLVYIIYDGVSVFILNIIIVTLPFYIVWVLKLNVLEFILFLIPPIICLIFSVKIITYISEKKSVKAALSYYLGICSVGLLVIFLAGIIGNIIFICVGWSIFMLGFSGDFVLHNVMRADTIDWDEYTTGERREAVYAGVGPLFSKPMISVALALPPAIMTIFGLIYIQSAGGLVATQGTANAALAVNISFALIPGLAALIGLIIWVKFYPLSKDIVEKMKIELLKIHDQKKDKLKRVDDENRGS